MKSNQISQQAYKQVAGGIFLLLFFAVSYLYFLNVSVVHVVMRKEADHLQNELRAEISMLETSYIAAQHEIASQIATLEGYQTEIHKTFINRNSTDTLVRAD